MSVGSATLPVAAGIASPIVVLAGVAIVALLVAEAWRRWALGRGVLDLPGHRSSHAVATPRGAGIGIVVAVVVGALWTLPSDPPRDAVLVSIVLAGAVGLFDDLRPLRPALKLAGQALAALPLAVALPLPIADVADVAMGPDTARVLGGIAALACALLYVNAWNFMDGIDGIAAAAAAAVCAAVWWAAPTPPGVALSLAPLLLAASFGFLPINLRRDKAFMGDCGSHALGMGVAALLLASAGAGSVWVAIAASAPFVVDVLGTLALRARDGERLTQAHRRHLYQLVTRSGYSHVRVTTAYAAWMLASGGSVAMAQSAGAEGPVAIVVLAATTAAWAVLVRHFGSLALRRESN